MKISPKDIAAYHLFLTRIVDVAESRGAPVKGVRAPLAVVRAWVDGEHIAYWATLAVTRVCHMLASNRDLVAEMVDDARGVVKGKTWATQCKRVDQMLAKAKKDAKPSKAPPRELRTKAPPPPPKSLDAIRKAVGPSAYKALVRRHAVFDAQHRGAPSKLRALLAKKNYRAHVAVMRFDEEFGGLLIPDRGEADWLEDGVYTCCGAFACLHHDGHSSPRGGDECKNKALVPVVYTSNDIIFYLDADGRAWGEDTIEDAHAVPFAKDGHALMAAIAKRTD